jgi:fumarylpyruvate hydrolase
MSSTYTHAPKITAVPVLGSSALFPVNRVFCVGRNYVEHAKEMGFTGREAPFFFMKPADAVFAVAPGQVGTMHYPRLTKDLHHEIELVVAIGQGGRCIQAQDAAAHIFGYAVGLDMTRRDLQSEQKKLGRPWDIGKSFDESGPIGHLVPAAAVQGLDQAKIELTVNGQVRQSSHIAKLIWNVAEIIEHLSAAWDLQAGDLIFTGTPEGVNAVVAGDVLHGSVSGLGDLRVQVAAQA